MLSEEEINKIAEIMYRSDNEDFSDFAEEDSLLIKNEILKIKKREDFANEHWRDIPENDRFRTSKIY